MHLKFKKKLAVYLNKHYNYIMYIILKRITFDLSLSLSRRNNAITLQRHLRIKHSNFFINLVLKETCIILNRRMPFCNLLKMTLFELQWHRFDGKDLGLG